MDYQDTIFQVFYMNDHMQNQNLTSTVAADDHPPTLIFVGFSKLPTAAVNMYGTTGLSLEIEVDPFNMKIVDAACNCLPPLSQKMVCFMLIGHQVTDVFEEAIHQIRDRYISVTQRAVIAALEDLQRQVRRYFQEIDFQNTSQKTQK